MFTITSESLASLPQAMILGPTCANEIAHRPIEMAGSPYHFKFTGSMQLSRVDCVPPVGIAQVPSVQGANHRATTN